MINKDLTEISSDAVRLPDYCTVYQDEVMAIQLAAEEASSILTHEDTYIKFFSDSQAALKSLTKYKIASKSVARAINAMNELGANRQRVELNWIKAQNNFEGNERADELARNSAYHNVVNFSIDPPFTAVKSHLTETLITEWNKEWDEDETCRMTKLFYPTMHKDKAKELCGLGRDKSRRFIEIITGENNLHYVQNKLKGTYNLCRLCEEEDETFDHFVNDCPCLWQIRRDHFGLRTLVNSHDWKTKTLLKFAEVPVIKEALSNDQNFNHNINIP